MEQIAENIYIEQGYPRVVLGALKLNHGLVLIDSPFQMEDVHTWQSKVSHLGGGVERLLIMMDAHIDRTYNLREMETRVLGHENVEACISSQSGASSGRDIEVDPDSLQEENPHGSRFTKPNMTFTDDVAIHWGDEPLLVLHKQGAHTAGLWVIYEPQKVVFVGDTIVRDQPPFLAFADIDRWIEDLTLLQTDRFVDYTIISSRSGIATQNDVVKMAEILRAIEDHLAELIQQEKPLKAVPEAASQLLTKINFDPVFSDRYLQRLNCGIQQYLQRHYLKKENE